MNKILKFFRLLSLLVMAFLIGSCVVNFKNNAAPFEITDNYNVEKKELFSNKTINENEEDNKKNEKDKKNEEDDNTSTILVGVSLGVSVFLLILTIGTVVRELKK